MKGAVLVLALLPAACAYVDHQPPPKRVVVYRTCKPLPPDLPPLRTPESLDVDRRAVRALYVECTGKRPKP